MRRLTLLLLTLLSLAGTAQAQDATPDIVLTGELTGADHQTYREVPFEVPEGTARITIEVAYSGRDERTTVDLGLRDPERFRGWSGGNKARFTLAAEEATPAYLPGPILPGTWRLILGVPNIRPASRSTYEARIWLEGDGTPFRGFTDAPLISEAGWYSGDLHTHTGHSDGACQPWSRRGRADPTGRVPCPVFRTVETAAERGLDFIAVTDHNTTSHFEALRELQFGHDRLLLIPGREITTFQGHANVFGPIAPIDFQVGGPRAPDMNAVIARTRDLDGLFSVNHPTVPSGEACMGCGWTVRGTDWSGVGAIEVMNGGSIRAMGGQAETPLSGIAFWEALLNEGHRITGIGGSDNHDPDLAAGMPSAIGRPTTIVWAEALSQPAVLEGLRSGRVFIDLDGPSDRRLEFSAEVEGGGRAQMGESLRAPGSALFSVTVFGVTDGRVEVVQDGRVVDLMSEPTLSGPPAPKRFEAVFNGVPGWIRINVRDTDGRLVLIGNPIYLNR